MKFIDDILLKIETSITSGAFIQVESEKVELKDNSHFGSDWNEVFKSANAFLNTEGGVIIIGIKEVEMPVRKYMVTGFLSTNENKLKTISKQFQDDAGNPVDMSTNFRYEFKLFQGKNIVIVYIDSLADDEKYVFFNRTAYERVLTGDHKISQQKVDGQREYKAELIDTRELKTVPDATLDDLDIHKLNDYIHLLNSDYKTESIKASLGDAMSFMVRQSMIRDGKPTLLGMLVCGGSPGDKLHFRSQLNAFVEAAGLQVAQDKKNINDTVLQLMEQGIAYVSRNIQTGVSTEQGGKRVFEYPERLIRECVNNSLAHRDYTINQFVSISITPGLHIQIRNPGRFKQQLLLMDLNNEIPIRRIIPGNSKANNPKLAKVLSVYNKWEGKGYGMATLTGAALEDQIDIPYYIFHREEVALIIPKGKMLDEPMESLIESYNGYLSAKLSDNITTDQKRVLAYFYKSELRNREDRYTILLTKDNNHLRSIQALEQAKLIERHPASNELYPVFVLDRSLFRTDFRNELSEIFGRLFSELPSDSKEVLSYIYERNHFASKKYPSANEVGSKLWIRKGNADLLEGYEIYKRKVRNIINKLEKAGMLIRHLAKPEYIVNKDFARQDLFGE